jgi:hypothetical protein
MAPPDGGRDAMMIIFPGHTRDCLVPKLSFQNTYNNAHVFLVFKQPNAGLSDYWPFLPAAELRVERVRGP